MSLAVRGLGLRYPRATSWTLHDVDLDLADGQVLLLLGPSGSGKSSIGLALTGLIPASIPAQVVGQITMDGLDVAGMSVAERTAMLGIVFQDPEAQFCLLTVEDEVAFGLENMALPRDEMDPRISESLTLVGLSEQRHQRLERLSGGQKQRLALACVLARRPRMLFLDEPTANLDPAARHDFYQLLGQLRRERPELGIIVVEHVLDDLIALVDRVAVLAPGDASAAASMLICGSTRTVFDQQSAVLDDLGIWLPQVTALALKLRQAGIDLPGLPLTVDEASQMLGPQLAHHRLPAEPHTIGLTEPDLALAVRNLSFAYHTDQPVLRQLSLNLPTGAMLALLGPNGSGKSTLSALLAGIRVPAPGTVFVLGRDLADLSLAQITSDVGYVFQNPEHQFLEQRVDAELAYSLRVRNQPKEIIATTIAQLLADFGLQDAGQRNPFKLSQGQKRRLSVATMLSLGQRILILDEPTFGQDRNTAHALMSRLWALHLQGVTILMITHDMQMVADYATHVAVMRQGQVIYQDGPDQLFADPTLLSQAALRPLPLHDLAHRLEVAYDDGTMPRSLRHWLPFFGLDADQVVARPGAMP